MPLVRNVMTGANIIASGKVARRFRVIVPPGTTSQQKLALLQTNTLPSCVWYCYMTSGPANVEFEPMFSVDNIANPAGPAGVFPRFFPVSNKLAVINQTPVLLQQRLVANCISARISVPAAAPSAATVEIILAASL